MHKERIAIVQGIRTPFCKGGGLLNEMLADDLGAFIVRELLARVPCKGTEVDHLIVANVLQPVHATNIARVIGVKAGLPIGVPAFTVNRNCASGLEAVAQAMDQIRLGRSQVVIAGGVESMSNFPVLVQKKTKEFLMRLSKARSFKERLSILMTFRLHMLVPDFPQIADPLCGLSMGQTAENLSREFLVTREEQDKFALMSHHRANEAIKSGRFAEEIVPIPLPPQYQKFQSDDDGSRADQTLEQLAKLKPVFDPLTGSVTAGNSSPITDGAAALLLASEERVKQWGVKPIGYITDSASAALAPSRMGLGPVFATAKLLQQTGLKLSDFDLIEINEAFAAQVIAVKKAFASDSFAQKELNLPKAIGEIDPAKLNVNGGAIALGHPLGASGTRLVLTMLLELKKRGLKRGLVTLCIGGGQGEAAVVEVV